MSLYKVRQPIAFFSAPKEFRPQIERVPYVSFVFDKGDCCNFVVLIDCLTDEMAISSVYEIEANMASMGIRCKGEQYSMNGGDINFNDGNNQIIEVSQGEAFQFFNAN